MHSTQEERWPKRDEEEEEDGNKERDDEDGQTERVVDEGLHSWMVQGDREDGGEEGEEEAMANREKTMQQGLSKWKFSVGRAANSSDSVPSAALFAWGMCWERERNGRRVRKEEGRWSCIDPVCVCVCVCVYIRGMTWSKTIKTTASHKKIKKKISCVHLDQCEKKKNCVSEWQNKKNWFSFLR